jgi:hypothetical protein
VHRKDRQFEQGEASWGKMRWPIRISHWAWRRRVMARTLMCIKHNPAGLRQTEAHCCKREPFA